MNRILDASVSAGNGGKYLYYRCNSNRGFNCPLYSKSVDKEIIEGELLEIFQHTEPTSQTIRLAKAMLVEKWHEKISQVS